MSMSDILAALLFLLVPLRHSKADRRMAKDTFALIQDMVVITIIIIIIKITIIKITLIIIIKLNNILIIIVIIMMIKLVKSLKRVDALFAVTSRFVWLCNK